MIVRIVQYVRIYVCIHSLSIVCTNVCILSIQHLLYILYNTIYVIRIYIYTYVCIFYHKLKFYGILQIGRIINRFSSDVVSITVTIVQLKSNKRQIMPLSSSWISPHTVHHRRFASFSTQHLFGSNLWAGWCFSDGVLRAALDSSIADPFDHAVLQDTRLL